MPATRSRTSTEAPEVAVEASDKPKDIEANDKAQEEVKDLSEEKANTTGAEEEKTEEDSEKPVDSEENGSSAEALVSDTNGDKIEEKVENGSTKRKSTGEEAGDAPDSTDITPKKAKVDSAPVVAEESANGAEAGAGEKQAPVETSA